MSASLGFIPSTATPGSNSPAPKLAPPSRFRALGPLAWPVLALVALLLFNYFFTPTFYKIEIKDGRLYGTLIDIMKNGTPTLLLALGMTLVIATGGIDLSVGAVMALTGAVAACLIAPPEGSLFRHADGTPFFSAELSLTWIILGGLGVALLCGIWNGVLVAYFRLQPIVATLILMVAGRGIAQLVTNGQIPTFEHPGFVAISGGFVFMIPIAVYVGVITAVVMIALIRGTALGLFVESVGNNGVAARIAGVNAVGVKLACYVLCGLLAGVAGLIYTSDIKAADVNNAGLYLELDAILAAAIGGTSLAGGRFSLLGSAIGALVIQTLTTTIYSLPNVPPESAMVAKAIIVILLCLIQSRKFRGMVLGLFGVRRPA